MLISLLLALLYVCILCVVGYAIMAIMVWAGVPMPPPVVIIFKAVVAIICIVILIQALTGSAWLNLPYLHR